MDRVLYKYMPRVVYDLVKVERNLLEEDFEVISTLTNENRAKSSCIFYSEMDASAYKPLEPYKYDVDSVESEFSLRLSEKEQCDAREKELLDMIEDLQESLDS